MQVATRDRRAAEMSADGRPLSEIAEALEYKSHSGAYRSVQRGLEAGSPRVEALRDELLADAALTRERLRPLIDRADPDLAALDRFLRSIELSARLAGLYRPQIEVTVNNTVEIAVAALQEHGQQIWAKRADVPSRPRTNSRHRRHRCCLR